MPGCTRPISMILLETGNAELSRLLDQAPPSKPPQVFSTPNSDITHRPRVSQIDHSKEYCVKNICQEHSPNTKICGTNSCKTSLNCSPRCLRAQRQGCVRLALGNGIRYIEGQAYLARGHRQKRFPPQNIPSLLLVTRLVL
jgi:hypothetical protein